MAGDATSGPVEGTVTFLLTDIQGSTQHWEASPDHMRRALEVHDQLVSETIKGQGGRVLTTHGEGDSFFAVFPLATQAVAAACLIQQSLAAQPWSEEVQLRVRMALHSGEAGGDYRGNVANRCARLRACGYGGQVLLSATSAELVRKSLPLDVRLLDLGKHRLRDLSRPERIFQLAIPGLPAEFPPLKSLKPGEQARLEVLEQVRRYWLQNELGQSLDRVASIELGLVERSEAVDNSLRTILRRPREPDRLLARGLPIAAVYRQLGKQLLILGEPGAGKTTMLLQLTDQLLQELEDLSAEPMPVIFHLSSWAVERRDLGAWMIDELHKRYGVPRRLGHAWMESDLVIPLLDGLDEVAQAHRDACMAAINDFHAAHGLLPLVVCSRTDEYEALQSRLRLQGAIVIQPLTRADIDLYLQQAGEPLAAVRAILSDDVQLSELLTTPLFLSIVALAYKGRPVSAVRASGGAEERRRRVLADYVEAMLSRPRASPAQPQFSRAETVSWLSWLARAMHTHRQSIFYLDWIQPNWLESPIQRLLVTGGVAATVALTIAAAFGLLFGPSTALIVGLGIALMVYERDIEPTERLRWSWTRLRHRLGSWLIIGLLIGSGFALVYWLLLPKLISGLTASFPTLGAAGGGLVFGLSFGIGIGLGAGLSAGLATQLYTAPTDPGRGIRVSLRNALVGGLVFVLGLCLIFGVAAGLVLVVFTSRPQGLVNEVALAGLVSLVIGLLAGLVFGLVAPESTIGPNEDVPSSWTTLRRDLLGGSILWLVVGLVFGVVVELGSTLGKMGGGLVGVADVLGIGLLFQLIARVGSWLASRRYPTSPERASVLKHDAFVSGVAAGLIFTLSAGYGQFLAVILAVGLVAGLRRGGGAYLRHHSIRWLLALGGSAPRDYPAFLDHAARLILLRRRGGGYEFGHRLLLEHFAELEPVGPDGKLSLDRLSTA